MVNTLQVYSDKLEKILCKYRDYLDEGCHLSGYDMADLIREVSGNELDARFVELYLKYVDTGRGGKILNWDITRPYNEDTSKMKKIVSERKIKHWQGYGSVDAKVLRNTPENMIIQVRGMHEYGLDCGAWDTDRVYEWLVKRFDPSRKPTDIKSVDIDDDYERQGNVDIEVCTYDISFKEKSTFELVQESADEETLKDIENTYGKKTALALDKYCKLFKKNPVDVVSNMKMDGNGMTEWDKFDVWAKRKLKVDIMGNFDDTVDWTGADEKKDDDKEDKKREKEERKSERKFKRGLRELRKNKKDLKKLRRGIAKRRPTRESTGSGRMEENDILDWIREEMIPCEWVEDIYWCDDGNAFEVAMPGPDADVFKVIVQKVYSGRLGKEID